MAPKSATTPPPPFLPDLAPRRILDNMLEAVVIMDDQGNIQFVNKSFRQVTGYSDEEVVGRNPRYFKDKRSVLLYKKIWASLERSGSWQGEIKNKRKNGAIFNEWLTVTSITDDENKTTHYMGIFTDITKKKRAEETIKRMAYYDPLTLLPNRFLFRQRLSEALHNSQRNGRSIGVLFLDLDRVKVINDTLGHDAGDFLLKKVSERVKESLDGKHTVARLGGDEFMILVADVENDRDITTAAEKILAGLKPLFEVNGHQIYITGSIGISTYPFDGRDVETLLKNADTALNRAKRRGRNNFQYFTQAMKIEALQQLALGNGLRRALDKQEFIVYYQPQMDIRSGEIVGVEALVRWQHPEFGLVLPTQFVHWAEDSGLIVPLGEMVLEIACLQSKRWLEKGFNRLKLAVNLSAHQFREAGLLAIVERILGQTGLPPSQLELELTESALMDLSGPSLTIPHELKAMGIGLSIDDFGTGYSSLAYLKRFPVNTLKMDRSFVRDINVNPSDAAIASAVIALGHSLDLTVIAEGVETTAQLDFLRQLGCDGMQGFLVSEPLPSDAFEALLQKNVTLNR